MIMESTWGISLLSSQFLFAGICLLTNREEFPYFWWKEVLLNLLKCILCDFSVLYILTIFIPQSLSLCAFPYQSVVLFEDCCTVYFSVYNFPRAFRYIIFLNYRQHCFCICSSSYILDIFFDKFLELNCLVKGMCNEKASWCDFCLFV